MAQFVSAAQKDFKVTACQCWSHCFYRISGHPQTLKSFELHGRTTPLQRPQSPFLEPTEIGLAVISELKHPI